MKLLTRIIIITLFIRKSFCSFRQLENITILCSHTVLNFRGRSDMKFVLFNRNVTGGMDINENLGYGQLMPNTPIKFIIHGFLSDGYDLFVRTLIDAYMSRDEDYNVVVVDWSKGSGSWLINYLNCLITYHVVPTVGYSLAAFIIDLVEKGGFNISYMDVIGYSLGAHIAGHAGKKLNAKGYKLPVIVGLDPALLKYDKNPASRRLAVTDAEYVEIIHTDPGRLGYEIPIGTADYYPNYGLRTHQPNCVRPICSHSSSFEYFARSIRKPTAFLAIKCKDFDTLKNKKCEDMKNTKVVRSFMGGPDMSYGKIPGIFYLKVKPIKKKL